MENFKLINQIQTAVIVVNSDMVVIEANHAFQDRYDNNENNIIGSKCYHSAYKFTQECELNSACSCPVQTAFLTKKATTTTHHYWVDNRAIVEEVIATPIIEKNGNVDYVVEEFRDVTKLLGLNKGIGEWVTFESYLHKNTSEHFSNGICEECSDSLITEHKKGYLCSH